MSWVTTSTSCKTIDIHIEELKMKRFLLTSFFLLIAAASVAPSAMARGSHDKEVMDTDNNGVVSLQERRLHVLDTSSN